MTIFVQIASYRDPELSPTLSDLFATAANPERLRVAVCWQHDSEDISMLAWRNHPQVQIDNVKASDSQGCCWSRARVQSLYRGEDYTLQLDSHHRFEPGWDETLIEMMRLTGAEKPIITAYGGSYDAITGKNDCKPWKMVANRPFGKDGALLCIPKTIENHEALTAPIPARFVSGHFLFTLGKWNLEVPYDPALYFHGEEPSLSARSYTHGYDLFHPHRIVVWHQYHRNGREKHWDNHPERKARLDAISKARVRKLFRMEENEHDLRGFTFGTVRTIEDYERYAGIDFARRLVHEECMEGVDPPTTYTNPAEWESRLAHSRSILLHWKSRIEIPEDCDFVAYIVESADGKQLWRQDAKEADDFQLEPLGEFASAREPARLIIWAHLKAGKWSPKKFSLALTSKTIYTP